MRNEPMEATTTLSSKILKYAIERGHSQAAVARMLDVSEGFISLVKSRERSLTLHHIELLAGGLGEPVGAMLSAATKPRVIPADQKEFYRRTEEFMRLGDKMVASGLKEALNPKPARVKTGVKAGARKHVAAKVVSKVKKVTKSRVRKAA